MPVNLALPKKEDILNIDGIQLGTTEAQIRKIGRKDLLVIYLAENTRVAGVFTTNRFCAAPVQVCRQHLAETASIRALVVNTGIANAGTSELGLANAKETCRLVAEALNVEPNQVLPFSTGVIMEHLPMDRIAAGIPHCVANLKADQWLEAAQAIMTTDIQPKIYSKQIILHGQVVSLTGMAKGSGMIHPNMATMLGYLATDIRISQALLEQAIKTATALSFNCVTVDGDTSTNDSFIVMATQKVNMPEITDAKSPEFATFQLALNEIAILLAQALARDGEGATKFMTIQVEQGRSEEECRHIAFAIAHSPLVKTAFFASDPNLGRILAAIGYAKAVDEATPLDVNQVQLYLGDVLVAENGGRSPQYQEKQAQAIMNEPEILIRVVLNRGEAQATVWTCDFSHDYVSINADYRS